jgi:hypothetical protein
MVFSEDTAFVKEFSRSSISLVNTVVMVISAVYGHLLWFLRSGIAFCIHVMVSRASKDHHIRIEGFDLKVFDSLLLR